MLDPTDSSTLSASPSASSSTVRLRNILAWIRTAKESLPAVSRGSVSTDRVVAMSALLDRLHVQAIHRRDLAVREGQLEAQRATEAESERRAQQRRAA